MKYGISCNYNIGRLYACGIFNASVAAYNGICLCYWSCICIMDSYFCQINSYQVQVQSLYFLKHRICGWIYKHISSNFTPNRIQQYNTVYMTNIANSRVIINIVMWFCWWPPEKPWTYWFYVCHPFSTNKMRVSTTGYQIKDSFLFCLARKS